MLSYTLICVCYTVEPHYSEPQFAQVWIEFPLTAINYTPEMRSFNVDTPLFIKQTGFLVPLVLCKIHLILWTLACLSTMLSATTEQFNNWTLY